MTGRWTGLVSIDLMYLYNRLVSDDTTIVPGEEDTRKTCSPNVRIITKQRYQISFMSTFCDDLIAYYANIWSSQNMRSRMSKSNAIHPNVFVVIARNKIFFHGFRSIIKSMYYIYGSTPDMISLLKFWKLQNYTRFWCILEMGYWWIPFDTLTCLYSDKKKEEDHASRSRHLVPRWIVLSERQNTTNLDLKRHEPATAT
jgi:hypothetical protein